VNHIFYPKLNHKAAAALKNNVEKFGYVKITVIYGYVTVNRNRVALFGKGVYQIRISIIKIFINEQ